MMPTLLLALILSHHAFIPRESIPIQDRRPPLTLCEGPLGAEPCWAEGTGQIVAEPAYRSPYPIFYYKPMSRSLD